MPFMVFRGKLPYFLYICRNACLCLLPGNSEILIHLPSSPKQASLLVVLKSSISISRPHGEHQNLIPTQSTGKFPSRVRVVKL